MARRMILTEEMKTGHIRGIRQEFEGIRRNLDRLALDMYADHLIGDDIDTLKKSPEYQAVIGSLEVLEEAVLKKYTG